jgi:outer membrane protein W
MKSLVKFTTSLLILLTLFSLTKVVKAQFEQKFTFQASAGYVQTVSPDWFAEELPYGGSFDAGMQYNFSRKLSVAVLVKYTRLSNTEEWFDDFNGVNYNYVYGLGHLGISLCPKYRFFTRSRINPYVFAGISLNYIHYWEEQTEPEQNTWKHTFPTSFGYTGGLGIDIRLNDNMALFLQGGLYWFVLIDEYDEGYDTVTLGEILNTFSVQLGININLFKSKSL